MQPVFSLALKPAVSMHGADVRVFFPAVFKKHASATSIGYRRRISPPKTGLQCLAYSAHMLVRILTSTIVSYITKTACQRQAVFVIDILCHLFLPLHARNQQPLPNHQAVFIL